MPHTQEGTCSWRYIQRCINLKSLLLLYISLKQIYVPKRVYENVFRYLDVHY